MTIFAALTVVGTAAVWTWLLLFIGPEQLVAYVGAENGYLIMFLVALLGGLATYTGVTYVATVLTLASAGFDPILLAVVSTAGVSTGDVLFYVIGYFGVRQLATGLIERWLLYISRWFERSSRVFLFAVVYCYAAFTPFPNDLLALVLGSARQPLSVIGPAFIVGNFTQVLLLAVLVGQLAI